MALDDDLPDYVRPKNMPGLGEVGVGPYLKKLRMEV